MASVMFGLILHFQYAYGWSPVRAGLANLPIIVTMIAATPFSEWLARRFGHRIACLVGAAFLGGSLAGLSWAVDHGYVAIAVCMVLMTIGLRTVMTICAVALVDAMPSNRTSMGTALNDTAQEVGTSVGTAVIGTAIAALVTTQLPAGIWSSDLVTSFFHGEQITYALLAVVVGLVTAGGALHPHRLPRHRGTRLTPCSRGLGGARWEAGGDGRPHELAAVVASQPPGHVRRAIVRSRFRPR